MDSTEMPRYKCHKEVWALKIERVDPLCDPGGVVYGATIVPLDKRYAPFDVGRDYVTKHNPQAGGYYVVYDDGYKSWSPAKAFEDGYALVSP